MKNRCAPRTSTLIPSRALAAALGANTALQVLRLSWNSVDEAEKQALRTAWSTRRRGDLEV